MKCDKTIRYIDSSQEIAGKLLVMEFGHRSGVAKLGRETRVGRCTDSCQDV